MEYLLDQMESHKNSVKVLVSTGPSSALGRKHEQKVLPHP
jgi:hypothetical protein